MMECLEQHVDNATFLRTFGAGAARRRVPLSGSIDLTYRCNLRCMHCYAGPESPAADADEMPTGLVKAVLEQATESGCLFMLLTGGEPLLRTDFAELYCHAKRLGLLVTVFTNATLVDDRVTALFEEWPPVKVETTLYGATGATHDGITGVTGSFLRTLAGVDRLRSRGVRVGLKTVVMKANISEYHAMETLAQERGVPFRMDAVLFPRLNGDRSPLEQLVDPADAVRLEMSNRKTAEAWAKYINRVSGFPASQRRYDCGAGISTFHVDPRANLFPCTMARDQPYSLREGTFEDGWRRVIPKVREEPALTGSSCGHCDRRASCAYCPGMLGPDAADTLRRHVCEAATARKATAATALPKGGDVAA